MHLELYGYGTIAIAGSTDNCHSAAAGQNDLIDCGYMNTAGYESCTTTDLGGGSTFKDCTVSLQAQPPGGWAFDHWEHTTDDPGATGGKGACDGSTDANCTFTSHTQDCDSAGPCVDTYLNDTLIAHFVDVANPVVGLTQAPPHESILWSDTQSYTFQFTSGEPEGVGSVRCQTDGGSYFVCAMGTGSYTWNTISDGWHDFCVQAVDASGRVSSPDCRHWDQQTNPTVELVTKPDSHTGNPDASFTYTSNKAGRNDGTTVSYVCALDGTPLAVCPDAGKAYSLLGNGPHTFSIAAVFNPNLYYDLNYTHQGPTTEYSWFQQDQTGPEIMIVSSPTGTTTTTGNASISWTGSEPTEQQTFRCKLDDAPDDFQPCTSPVNLSGLANGTHHFQIDGRDFLGNYGPVKQLVWTVAIPTSSGSVGSGEGSTTEPSASTPTESVSDRPATSPVSGSTGAELGSAAVAAKLARAFKVSKLGALVTKLKLSALSPGAGVTIACNGKGCAFKSKKASAEAGGANLAKLFKKRLKPGSVITIKVTKTGMRTTTFQLTVQKKGQPICLIRRG